MGFYLRSIMGIDDFEFTRLLLSYFDGMMHKILDIFRYQSQIMSISHIVPVYHDLLGFEGFY